MNQIMRWKLFFTTTMIIFPNIVIEAVVEVKVLKVLKLSLSRREQLLTEFYVRIHRPPHIKEDQYLHCVSSLGHHFDI